MTETVAQRMDLLLESDQISPRVSDATLLLMSMVEERLHKPAKGESAVMFATHLALALERLSRGEPITASLPESVLAEVRTYEQEWQFAEVLAEHAGQVFGVALPQSEIGYITAHLAALSQESEGEDEV